MRGGVDIAAIDAADRPIAKERPAEIEIEMPDEAGILLAGGTDRGCGGCVSRTVLLRIGGGMPNAGNDSFRRNTAFRHCRQTEKCLFGCFHCRLPLS